MEEAKGRILVVDDESINRILLSTNLREARYCVETAEDGRQALDMLAVAAAADAPFDVVLLDLVMPNMDGYQVLARMKEDENLRHVPVIVVSSSDEMDSIVRCIEMGATDHLSKPFNPVLLHARLNASLASKRMHDIEQAYLRQVRDTNGQIQASILPQRLPQISGWQLAATLEPAREMAGDFYDLIPLPNGRWGLVMADVTDKGAGAALYMVLSCTLMRTYAAEHPTQPEHTLRTVNTRLLADAHTDMFVTLFYGILDPLAGTLEYSNAGHVPPYHLCRHSGNSGSCEIHEFRRTGPPLGILKDVTWERRTAHLAPGDALLLYTDGITEAQDQRERFFGEERLTHVARAYRGSAAQEIEHSLLGEVHEFVGDAPQSDDLTLMVTVRDLPETSAGS
jgi:serine phosphatase RsbU (regulator of sigma subunit)